MNSHVYKKINTIVSAAWAVIRDSLIEPADTEVSDTLWARSF